MPTTLRSLEALDVRFPTSRELDGSDAMNEAPDYSAATAVIRTSEDGLEGHGLTFTIGRGNELCARAIEAFRPLVVGKDLDAIEADPGRFWRSLAGESQLRWVGPEKGVIHLALAAVVNAVWDLLAKRAGVPLWKYVTDLPSERIVRALDLRHVTDYLTAEEALDLLRDGERGAAEREAALRREGIPAYTTSAGWLGYSDDKIRDRCAEAIAAGWDALKIKVGRDLDDDLRRLAVVREAIGGDRLLMIDANQVWEVDQAIEWTRRLAPFDPYWIEEPVSPDDVLGHRRVRDGVRPIRVATGEHAMNRVLWKQFFQAEAIDVCQLDGCRLGGVNEVLVVLLMARKAGVPVCPHAGGVGLCEVVQHLSMIDHLRIGASTEGRFTEQTDHLHEHFVDPIRVDRGRYVVPERPGFSQEMRGESVTRFRWGEGEQGRAGESRGEQGRGR